MIRWSSWRPGNPRLAVPLGVPGLTQTASPSGTRDRSLSSAPEVAGVLVRDHLARIVEAASTLRKNSSIRYGSGPATSTPPSSGAAQCHAADRLRDVIGRDGLEEHRRHADLAVLGSPVGDAGDELVELCGVHDRVRDRGLLDQLLLRNLRAQVAAVRRSFGPHDRQGDVVTDAGRHLLRPAVSALRSRKNSITAASSHDGELDTSITTDAPAMASCESFAGQRVDPGVRRGRSASCPREPSILTTFEPIRPVPPITTIFMSIPLCPPEPRMPSGHQLRPDSPILL